MDKDAMDRFCEYALEGEYVDAYMALTNGFDGYEKVAEPPLQVLSYMIT